MSYHKIVETFYPYLCEDKKEQSKLLTDLLQIIDKKHGSAKIFPILYKILNLELVGDIFDMYEKLGPILEYSFGEGKCCSLRWGVEVLSNGMTIQKKCSNNRMPGFLYCTVHNRNIQSYCKSCVDKNGQELFHSENWEHFGNIFDKEPRISIKNYYKQLKTSAENHLNYSAYLIMNQQDKSISSKITIDKPIKKIEQQQHPKEKKNEALLLKSLISLEKVETKPKLLTKPLELEEMKIMETALYYYVLSKGLIKPKKLDENDNIEELNIYDSNELFYHDKRFVYRKTQKGFVGCGIFLNNDSCILEESIKIRFDELDEQQINTLIGRSEEYVLSK